MAEINFPKNPDNNQIFIVGSKTWIWKDSINAWVVAPAEDFNSLLRNLNTDIIPSIDSEYDLGSPTKKWKDLYLSGNTIYLGSLKLSDDNGSVKVVTLDGDAEVATAVSPISGGTGLTSYTTGDMIYSNSANSLAKLNIGADGTILVSDGTKPIWVDASSVLSDDSVEYAVLTDGKLNPSVLPSLAITDTFVVSSESAMLALTAETGDVAIRTDINSTFILSAGPASTLSNWKELLTPESDIPMIPISKVTNLQTNLDAKATTVDYSTTLPSTGWSGSGPFEIQVTTNLNAIVDTDKPIIDLDMTSVAFADVDTVNTEWAKVYRAVSGTGNITFYAKEVPTVALVLQVKVVK